MNDAVANTGATAASIGIVSVARVAGSYGIEAGLRRGSEGGGGGRIGFFLCAAPGEEFGPGQRPLDVEALPEIAAETAHRLESRRC